MTSDPEQSIPPEGADDFDARFRQIIAADFPDEQLEGPRPGAVFKGGWTVDRTQAALGADDAGIQDSPQDVAKQAGNGSDKRTNPAPYVRDELSDDAAEHDPPAFGSAARWASPGPLPDDDSVYAGLEEHFVPEPVQPLPDPEEDPTLWTMLCCLGGGLLMLLYAVTIDRGGSHWWPITGITLVIVGFVLLVMRGSGRDDDYDDGARL